MPGQRRKVLDAALAKAQRLLRRREVLAVGIGQRHRHGRWIPGAAGIVVKVDWKLGEVGMRAHRRKPIDPWVDVDVDDRSHRVWIDVQETRGERAGRLQGLVGGVVSDGSTQVLGSISAIVRCGDNPAVLISGHVGGQVGARLKIAGLTGTARAPVLSNRLDHCLLDADSALPADASMLVDGTPLHGVVPVAKLTTNSIGYFQRAATGNRVAVVIRHVEMTAPFGYPAGTVQMKGLIVTDGATVDGDSGALLYDNGFRAIGTLIGMFAGESYFIPCEHAFSALGLSLV